MLSEDASFSMPPLPTWFRGRDDIAAFLTARVFRTTWRFEVTSAGGQPAMLGRRRDPGSERYELRVLTVLTFEGELDRGRSPRSSATACSDAFGARPMTSVAETRSQSIDHYRRRAR